MESAKAFDSTGRLESELDWHVEQLLRCEKLSEEDVRLLCGKVMSAE
jgi:hypothetical protein